MYRQELLDTIKKWATDGLKTTSKIVLKKAAEAFGDVEENKITNTVTTVVLQKTSSKSTTPTTLSKADDAPMKIPRWNHKSPENQEQIIEQFRWS